MREEKWEQECACPAAPLVRQVLAEARQGARVQSAPRVSDAGAEVPELVDEQESRAWTKELRRGIRAYVAYGALSVGLALAAWRTHGAVRVFLAVLAVLLAVVTVWSVLIVGGLVLLVSVAKRSANHRTEG